MKRHLFITAGLLALSFTANAWGGLGHQVVIAVAQRHLTEKTKQNIAAVMPYDMKKDAVWMDVHRKDADIAYTTAFHVYNVNPATGVYDPTPRDAKGDCVRALYIADYVLRNRAEMNDSTVLINLREILHFVGDLHCPTHSYLWEPGSQKWPVMLNGRKYDTFHSVYDRMPSLLYPDMKADEVAEIIDDASKGQIRKIAKGSFLDWAAECGERNAEIYDINPAPEGHKLANGAQLPELDPDTVEKSREVCNRQMRDAGYRLARLLNEYFGK